MRRDGRNNQQSRHCKIFITNNNRPNKRQQQLNGWEAREAREAAASENKKKWPEKTACRTSGDEDKVPFTTKELPRLRRSDVATNTNRSHHAPLLCFYFDCQSALRLGVGWCFKSVNDIPAKTKAGDDLIQLEPSSSFAASDELSLPDAELGRELVAERDREEPKSVNDSLSTSDVLRAPGALLLGRSRPPPGVEEDRRGDAVIDRRYGAVCGLDKESLTVVSNP
eukprot:m.269271 g.269271  ORF g.269271 m.269271 type:complete len:225 (-) comp19300_c1_seq5:4229-4903(-)